MVKVTIPIIEKEKRIPLFIVGLFSFMCIFPIVSSISYDSGSVSPSSPRTYPIDIEFNVTWNTSDYIISTSYIEHNNTGTLANYTMIPVGMDNSGLVGYWKFNNDWNNTHVPDLSGNNNIGSFNGYTAYDGTLTGDGNEWATGKYGYGLELEGTDSNDYVTIGTNTEFYNLCTNGCTISAWVWVADDSDFNVIAGRWDTTDDNRFFLLRISSSNIIQFYSGRNGTATGWSYTNGGAGITRETWTYVTGVYNGTHVVSYKNGIYEASATMPYGIDTTAWQDNENTFIGTHDDGNPTHEFNGTIDNVGFWNTPLTQAQIQQEMVSDYPVNTQYLYAHYRLEENTGTAIHDTNMIVGGTYEGAGRFDGTANNQRLECGDITEMEGLDEISIGGWATFGSNTADGSPFFRYLFYKPYNAGLVYVEDTQSFFPAVYNSTGHYTSLTKSYPNSVLTGKTHHLFMTWKSISAGGDGKVRLYIDGQLNATASAGIKGTTPNTATNLLIGSDSTGRHINATIDDVRVYERELSATEVQTLYELTNPDQETFTYDLDAWATTFSYKFIGIDANSESAVSSSDIYNVNKAEANLVLTSSNGWELSEGQSTTLQCTANENATIKLYADDSLVTPPYIFEPELGTHDIICDIGSNFTVSNTSETLTVNPLIACTDISTFAFQKNITTSTNITTLNFTSIVANEYVKTDLSDVDIDNVSDVWINTTDGYYVVVNNTGLSDFTVNFGNYIVNNDYNETATENIIEIDDYTQINAYTKIHSLDEVTGESMYPTNSTLMAIIHCDRGEDYITIEDGDTDILVATKEYIDRASLRVKYSADVYYSRQLYQEEVDRGNLNFYVVDAYEYAVDRIDFHMIDVDYYDSKLQVYKTIQSTPIIITEGYFDASHYFSGYLMEDSEYYLRTYDSDSTYTEFGTLYVTVPAEKELGQTEMDMTSDALLISDNILMNAWMSDNRTQLNIKYEDATNQTQQLNITTYFGNGTQFQFASYDNTSSVNLAYNTTNYTSESFYVDFSILHETFGNSPVTYSVSVFASSVFDLGIGAMWLQLISMGAIVLIGGIATRKTLVAGVVLSLTMLLFFWGIGWLVIETVFIVFMVFLGILAIIIYLKQGGE